MPVGIQTFKKSRSLYAHRHTKNLGFVCPLAYKEFVFAHSKGIEYRLFCGKVLFQCWHKSGRSELRRCAIGRIRIYAASAVGKAGKADSY